MSTPTEDEDDGLDEYDAECRQCHRIVDRMTLCPVCYTCPDCCEDHDNDTE